MNVSEATDSAVITGKQELPKIERSDKPNQVEPLANITPANHQAIVLKEILQQAQRLVSYRTAHVMLLEDDMLRIAAWHGYQAFGSEELISNLAQPLANFPLDAQVVRTCQPLLVPDTQQEPQWVIQNETRWVRSNVMLPISLAGHVLGLLRLDADTPHAFSNEDIFVLQPLASVAAIALENARLYNQAQQEISERKRVEEALQEGLEQLRIAYQQAQIYAQELTEEIHQRKRVDKERRQLIAAIEQTAESVVISNLAGRIIYVNPAFERITGYSRSEVLGTSTNIFNSGVQDSPFYQKLWETVNAGKVWQGRFVNKKKDGSLYTLDATISPVRDKKGVIVNYVEVGHDVTRELLLEEQYRHAQKMEAVGRLAGGIAHDFNNLLIVIIGYAEMTQSQLPPDHPVQEFVEAIRDSGQHAVDLVKQLLAFSRQQITAPTVLDLNAVIANLSKMLRRLIGEDTELQTDLWPDLWLVKIDPTQIEQVIANLAVNAHDAMPQGGRLTIGTANVVLDESYSAMHLNLQPGEYVLLTVGDTGTGISEDVKAHIFEPFFTTKEAGKGTGLGLATVLGIVAQNGGHVWVDSKLGQGTTFKIYLPRAKEAVPVPTERPRRQADDLPRGTETVLLVEDEPKVKDLANRLLRRQGYTVLTAAHGIEALQIGQEFAGEIHLLLTDVIMPYMNGKKLADQFKLLRPNIKILFASGYTDKALIPSHDLGPDTAFIQKPFSVMELSQKVRSILDS
jgi:PAS domain S-box-containing protein